MSKRRAAEPSNTGSRKRIRKDNLITSSPPPSVAANPRTSDHSTRRIASNTVSGLGDYCIKSFSADFRNQCAPANKNKDRVLSQLHALPEHLLLRLWNHLTVSQSTYISHNIITAVFLRGSTVILPRAVVGVTEFTVKHVARLESTLRHFELIGHNIADKVVASTLSELPSLEHLSLKDCRQVASLSCKAIQRTHDNLRYLNLSGTTATFMDIRPILFRNHNLEVLKLVGLENLTDHTVAQLVEQISSPNDERDENGSGDENENPLTNIHTLKLRHTLITGVSLASLFPLLPQLKNLDVSFVPINHLPLDINHDQVLPLTKLSLTSTPIDARNFIPILEQLSNLRVLNIGALGASAKSANGFTIGSTGSGALGSRTLTDATLMSMTNIMMSFPHLESVSLAGNSSLGVGAQRGLPSFIQHVGRKLKSLDLGGISRLQSRDLEGLLMDTGGQPCRLERLILMGCNVDDEAGIYIAACPSLSFLDLEGTKITEVGLFEIIDACPRLESLNLTSCRGVKVTDRRRFFEVWEARNNDNS